MDYREIQGKQSHDPIFIHKMNNQYSTSSFSPPRCVVFVPGPVIVGAGPSGLATGRLKTYDRLRLHLPKQFCELPLVPFPADFPTYPTKQQFIHYLEDYANKFDIQPSFNQTVSTAQFDPVLGFWRVLTAGSDDGAETEYVTRWLIAATGENAEAVVPRFQGMMDFGGPIRHTSLYKSGEEFRGKKVLVVGCGNSGMEVCLDLCNHNARPSLVVRDTVHVLPRDVLGKSTFGLSMWLLKWLPMRLVDRLLLVASRLLLGDTSRLGLDRPQLGPLELKNLSGKTPVLDVGTLAKIKSGDIQIYPAIKRLKCHRAIEFVDGRTENFDAIVLATGYRSNVPSWLKEGEMFSKEDGLPKTPFPNGWKGECGLYAVGFTKRGILGASIDAKRIAEDIERCWKAEAKHSTPFARSHLLLSSSP
ncbi:hypothetical protein M0R45_012154 [Rubus argutus]|uniref:Flavin-containing monooxygenase n=1 Tax=Rubus argutus TaxID=59490 RepID=A0AAW1YF06_RUBAR